MSHLSELQLLMLADSALPADQQASSAEHLATCASCQQQLAALQQESDALASILRADAGEADADVPIPSFTRPTSLRNFAVANLAVGLAIWLPQFLWKTLFGELVVNGTTWLTSVYLPDTYDLVSTAALQLMHKGTTMLDTYLVFVATALVTITALWAVLLLRRSRGLQHLCVLGLFATVLLAPAPADALETMKADATVTVPAGDTVDDTLVVGAQRIVIAGTVTGDLIAMGEEVEIEGRVIGNLVTFAKIIRITGSVGGSLIGAGQRIELVGGAVSGNLWAAGERISIDNNARVDGNAIMATETGVIEGPVGRDLVTFGETVELDAVVGADLKVAGRQLRLLDNAHVMGDVQLRLRSQDQLERADTARIDGELEFLAVPEKFEPRSRYATPTYYMWQLVRLVTWVLVGLALLWLFPGLRTLMVPGGLQGVKTAGIGLIALVSMPILAFLAAATLVGLPFGLVGIAAWLLLFYVAKIVVAVVVGRLALANTAKADSDVLAMLVGMVLVLLAINLPWIGGPVGAVLTIIGAGLIVQRAFAARA